MKSILSSILFLLCFQSAFGQLVDGSIAPDFTAKDINGVEWHLYDILDQGKSVVLDISATWCAPCWQYHSSGVLENYYELYGPNGTGTSMVFLIEGDKMTTLADLQGTGTNTQGNWVEGTPYPIIDSRDIAEVFAINFYPTIYMICPNRRVTLIDQVPLPTIVDYASSCPVANGTVNASVMQYKGFEGEFCGNLHFPPTIVMQNSGLQNLTSATVSLQLNGNTVQQINWTGDLPAYHIAEIVFDSLFIDQNTALKIKIENPNGIADSDPGNNQYNADIKVAQSTSTAVLKLELQLDAYPFETYWELTNSQGKVLYYDGNRQVKYPTESAEASFSAPNSLHTYQIALPSNDCYAFSIYDRNNDGLYGNAYYKLRKADASILLQGGAFLSEETTPFGLHDSPGIENNAAILSMQPFPADFCFAYSFIPKLRIQNIGRNSIAKMVFSTKGQNETYPDYTWTGTLPVGNSMDINLPAVTVPGTDEIKVRLISVNDKMDEYDFKNEVIRTAFRRKTLAANWLVDIQTDAKGYELYWQITNDAGDILFSGGNMAVGPNGGGLGSASPTDAGAYQSNQHFVINANLPGPGCYHLKVVDDGGNGMAGGLFGVPNPYLKIRNNVVGIIVQTTGNFTNEFTSNIEIASTSGTTEAFLENNTLVLSPNPVSSILSVQDEDITNNKLLIKIVNAGTGQVLMSREGCADEKGFLLDLPVHTLPNGLMILTVTTARGSRSKIFVVQH